MNRYITTNDNVLIACELKSARENTHTRKIETELLDGSYLVQTVGTASILLNVELLCGKAQRRHLQQISNVAGLIKVYYDDRCWVGHIRTGNFVEGNTFVWTPVSPNMESVTFTMMVVEEIAL
jgi:hypothetical protein